LPHDGAVPIVIRQSNENDFADVITGLIGTEKQFFIGYHP
jgi:hypothetical protein